MGEPKVSEGHSVTVSQFQSLGYGERHLWEATIGWEGERRDLNTAKVKVRRDGFTLFSDSLVRWNQACAVIEEATKVWFQKEQ